MRKTVLKWAAALLVTALAGPVVAAPRCQNTANFEKWLADFKKDALAQGISPQVMAEAAPDLTFDPTIIKRDQGQAVFNLTFLQFSDKLIAGYRMQNGMEAMKKNAAIFARVEKQYGVPAPVLTAFWGLESDFGKMFGNYRILRALTTLAYDCRRPDFFRQQLLDALRIVQRGDQRAEDMIGDWAGEFGGMQFTASDYLKNAVDFDGDGRRDLIRSIPDTLASAANFLVGLGWQRGQPWLQEVRVPQTLKWEEADLNIQHPVSQWAAWGVKPVYGKLPDRRAAGGAPAADGPAWPGLPRLPELQGLPRLEFGLRLFDHGCLFRHAAERRAGGRSQRGDDRRGAVDRTDDGIAAAAAKHGYDVGEPDGKLGNATRAAVKQAQIKAGLPADSWPTQELIAKLRGG